MDKRTWLRRSQERSRLSCLSFRSGETCGFVQVSICDQARNVEFVVAKLSDFDVSPHMRKVAFRVGRSEICDTGTARCRDTEWS
jgi:hypothetical protein